MAECKGCWIYNFCVSTIWYLKLGFFLGQYKEDKCLQNSGGITL